MSDQRRKHLIGGSGLAPHVPKHIAITFSRDNIDADWSLLAEPPTPADG